MPTRRALISGRFEDNGVDTRATPQNCTLEGDTSRFSRTEWEPLSAGVFPANDTWGEETLDSALLQRYQPSWWYPPASTGCWLSQTKVSTNTALAVIHSQQPQRPEGKKAAAPHPPTPPFKSLTPQDWMSKAVTTPNPFLWSVQTSSLYLEVSIIAGLVS